MHFFLSQWFRGFLPGLLGEELMTKNSCWWCWWRCFVDDESWPHTVLPLTSADRFESAFQFSLCPPFLAEFCQLVVFRYTGTHGVLQSCQSCKLRQLPSLRKWLREEQKFNEWENLRMEWIQGHNPDLVRVPRIPHGLLLTFRCCVGFVRSCL